MSEITSEILSLIADAVIIAKGGRIELANPAAKALLGEDCTGRRVSAVFGRELAESQSSDYIANASLAGKSCILHVSKKGSNTTFIIREEAGDIEIINDAFICSMRSSLNLLMSSADRCRLTKGEECDPMLSAALASLTKSIYITANHISNLSYTRNIFEDKLEYFPVPTDLAELCREYADYSQSMLDVRIEVEAAAPVICAVDEKLFAALFANLISNAVSHGKADRITLRLSENAENAVVTFTDNGAGIPSDKLINVFERYRAPFTLGELYNGAGLGLTVVRGIAARHGGTLLLESREGSGTSVHVSLRKTLVGTISMRSTDANISYTRDLMTGLSKCMDAEKFGKKYMD